MSFYIVKDKDDLFFKMNQTDPRFNSSDYKHVAQLKHKILDRQETISGHKVIIQEDVNGSKYYIFNDYSALTLF